MITMKKILLAHFSLIIVFVFSTSIYAADVNVKNEDKAQTQTQVKTEKSEVKTEKSEVKTDANQVKNKSAANIGNKININKATESELSAGLKKVGPKYAAAIVKYREANGKFASPEDIKKVKGIGDKIFELNKDIIVVTD